MSYGAGYRYGSDLWLWIGWQLLLQLAPWAWEPPYAMSTALKSKKKKKVVYHLLVYESICWIKLMAIPIIMCFILAFQHSLQTITVAVQ